MKKEKNEIVESSKVEKENLNSCTDKTCPIHGSLKTRGRSFKGYVIRKFPRRVTIEFERVVSIRKYERYYMKKTRIHARLPNCMKEQINLGDYIEVKECRPLSKIIHFVVIKKIKSKEEKS
ncbi:MAG: 30S ribosomal protein S17 [Candidatus Pacearchaeota archaeon]